MPAYAGIFVLGVEAAGRGKASSSAGIGVLPPLAANGGAAPGSC